LEPVQLKKIFPMIHESFQKLICQLHLSAVGAGSVSGSEHGEVRLTWHREREKGGM